MKRVVLGALLAIAMPFVAVAGFDEGKKAFDASDYARAIKEWLPIAEQGNAQAQGWVARLYYNGWGVREDYTKALEWARKASSQNDSYGENVMGLLYSEGQAGLAKDYEQAIKWWRKAADKGLALAQNNLGNAYVNGDTGEQDLIKAREWFQKSADQGNAGGMYGLGMAYGLDGAKDVVQAVFWLRKAALLGNAGAQKEYGALYDYKITKNRYEQAWGLEEMDRLEKWAELNKALPRDLVMALVYYRLAAKGENPDAKRIMQDYESYLSREQLAEADSIMKDWKPGQDLPLTSKTGPAPRVVP